MLDSPRILVTGATGFLGRHLIPILADKYPKLTALVRENSDVRQLKELGVRLYYADLSKGSLIKDVPEGVDIILHLAALMSDKDHLPYAEFRKVNVEGTLNLLKFAGSSIRQFILVSTVGVYGATTSQGFDEDAPYGKRLSKYERSKAEAEEAALGFCRRRNLNLTILRIGQLYGPGMKYGWPQVLRNIEEGRMYLLGRADNLLHLTYVSDAVKGILLSINNSNSYGKAFNICAREPSRVKDIFTEMAGQLGRPLAGSLPLWPVYFLAVVLEIFPRKLKPNRLKYLDTHRLDFFRFDHAYKIERAGEILGYVPEVDLKSGVSRLLEWYRGSKGGN
jgi:nucleoside-diphosphate-sugar epimerase